MQQDMKETLNLVGTQVKRSMFSSEQTWHYVNETSLPYLAARNNKC